ncbi:MAG: prepilin-type N-terminal cleavage/methylation domain-containing protein [bacterium]
MKLNNKGLSLIELVIAVGLISIVVVFLYNLLNDLNDKTINSDFAINNQITRFEIIDYIQKDLLGREIDEIKRSTSSGDSILTINYIDGDTLQIKIKSNLEDALTSGTTFIGDMVTVTLSNGTDELKRSWYLDINCFIESEISNEMYVQNSSSGRFYIKIPIYTTNDANSSSKNNTLDDIVIYHMN